MSKDICGFCFQPMNKPARGSCIQFHLHKDTPVATKKKAVKKTAGHQVAAVISTGDVLVDDKRLLPLAPVLKELEKLEKQHRISYIAQVSVPVSAVSEGQPRFAQPTVHLHITLS